MTKADAKLYLIPTPLGDDALHTIPPYVIDIMHTLDVFIVEKAKTARQYLKSINFPIPFDDCLFFELNKHTEDAEWPTFLDPAKQGRSIGLLSEAGVPAVADPGSKIVKQAHARGIAVMPLVGPSSLLLAIMGAGMNGQAFSFKGYLSPKRPELAGELKRLEAQAIRHNETVLFIETPYRNNAVFETALQVLNDKTLFSVAMDLTLSSQYIKTFTIEQWKKEPQPELHKRPAVFLVGKLR